MTRNWIKITDRHGKEHVVNAADIIDIFDEKSFTGYKTIFCVDSKNIDIDLDTYKMLLTVLKPSDIDEMIKKAKAEEVKAKEKQTSNE